MMYVARKQYTLMDCINIWVKQVGLKQLENLRRKNIGVYASLKMMTRKTLANDV